MKIENQCIKSLTSGLKERHFLTNLHLTIPAANENLMYPLEPDVLPVKQHVARERIKESGVAVGDPWAPVRESADGAWKDWGMLIY